ncbi:MAG: thioredoxin [Ruminococcaceae bacterium]|nr:thioredoxin [Oscillospiraceae bacterium]MBQ7120372.1 thioredoxin [Oscillospiraceae bacterium]
MSNALALTAKNFEETLSKGVALVDFWASWCGPCMMLAPTIDEVAEDFSGRAGVYKVNVDDEGELAARFGIMSIPTLIVFRDGEVFDKLVGVVPKENIAEVIENALK